jgi:hypothetical protein
MNEAAPDIFLPYSREDLAVTQAYRDALVERRPPPPDGTATFHPMRKA